ncbi:hypothetical protein [Lentzea sp. NPDC059081]|uniref:hypothetical protein n=1 Tax=Lentzea sp. NPDC059081 TaxID=3346719 RepID=UPI0036BB81C4
MMQGIFTIDAGSKVEVVRWPDSDFLALRLTFGGARIAIGSPEEGDPALLADYMRSLANSALALSSSLAGTEGRHSLRDSDDLGESGAGRL